MTYTVQQRIWHAIFVFNSLPNSLFHLVPAEVCALKTNSIRALGGSAMREHVLDNNGENVLRRYITKG
jgi:hypothetical protein